VAADDENLSVDQRVRRSVARTLGNAALALIVVGALGFWASLGAYTLDPGEAAILLRLGRHMDTVTQEGFHLTLPPPIVTREIVNIGMVRNEDFGVSARPGATGEAAAAEASALAHEASMQTSDNNIVRVSFTLQYRIQDAYAARYKVADLTSVVRSASAAAMREVVGRMTVDAVLRERRAALTTEVSSILQDILESYGAGLEVQAIELQDVQPPEAVRSAFDDVVAATQDASRAVNEAEGYRNQVIPNARAEAIEMVEAASGYRAAKVAEAAGEAARFTALTTEYRKAPEVTRKRLYLETMESVLPGVEKVIIERGAANFLPYLPIGRDRGER
jgi:membrane protease subunit HflK